jgi:hypothetical protein
MYNITIDGILTYVGIEKTMAEAIITYFRHACGCVVSYEVK